MAEVNLHAKDILNLADVKNRIRTLYGMRKAIGWQVKDMQEGNGYAHGYIARMLGDERNPWDWKWSTFANLGECLDFRPDVELRGFVLADTPMIRIGALNPTFRGVGLLESFRLVREQMDVTGTELGRRMGCTDSSVSKIENSDNPKLASLMRYARGLGGELKFVVGEK